MNTAISMEPSSPSTKTITKKRFFQSTAAAAAAEDDALAEIYSFRPIQQSDRSRVKVLHEEWFPVV